MAGFSRFHAAIYDPIMRGQERRFLGRLRDDLLGRARGETLEIGAGTGLNLPRYRTPTRVVATEPSPQMLARLHRRVGESQVPVVVEEAVAEALPFDDASFDTVVTTLVMCSVPDPMRAMAEIRRVLKPGGSYLFLEHGGSDDDRLARWQRRLDRAWTIISAGCHLDRNITTHLGEAGLSLTSLETYEPRRSGPIKPFRLGVAS